MTRSIGERLAAWLYTGPVGRLYGPLADVVGLWAEWARRVARERAGRLRP
jgi:hypothetical protein